MAKKHISSHRHMYKENRYAVSLTHSIIPTHHIDMLGSNKGMPFLSVLGQLLNGPPCWKVSNSSITVQCQVFFRCPHLHFHFGVQWSTIRVISCSYHMMCPIHLHLCTMVVCMLPCCIGQEVNDWKWFQARICAIFFEGS